MTPPQRGLLFMALGFAVWLVVLSTSYAVQAAGCAWSWQHIALGPFSLLRAVLVALFVAAMGILLLLFILSRGHLVRTMLEKERDRFLWRASFWLTLAAISATVWIAMPLPLPFMCR